jgi:hypothetical protein
MFKDAKSFNQNLTIWRVFNSNLDNIVFSELASHIEYCKDSKDLTSDYINDYLSKKESELRE